MKTIGLIAGGGQFPILFARAARQNGVKVVAVALKGEADELLESEVDVCSWVSLGKLTSSRNKSNFFHWLTVYFFQVMADSPAQEQTFPSRSPSNATL